MGVCLVLKPLLIPNVMSLHVYNMIQIKGMMQHLNKSNVAMTKSPQSSQLYGFSNEQNKTYKSGK